jgi:hypothetical protein
MSSAKLQPGWFNPRNRTSRGARTFTRVLRKQFEAFANLRDDDARIANGLAGGNIQNCKQRGGAMTHVVVGALHRRRGARRGILGAASAAYAI